MKMIGNGIGIKAPEGMHVRTDAARLIGRSPDTLKRWHQQGIAIPSECMQAGKLRVWLYTAEDIEHLKEIAASQRPGRKAKAKT
jgi:DNA-binding transcriptional MerR regulator